MTRKQFKELAFALSYAKPSTPKHPCYEQWLLDIDMVASACAGANPRFNRDKFIEACKQDPKV